MTQPPRDDEAPRSTEPPSYPRPDGPPSYPGPEGPPSYPSPEGPFGAAPPYQTPYGPGYGGGYGAEELPLGGRWRRLFAGIVDWIIVWAITAIITAPFGRFVTITGSNKTVYTSRDVFADVVALVIGIAYYWIQNGMWGQTLGKRLFKLRVVNMTGGPLSWGQAGIRIGFQYLLSVVTCGIGEIVDLAWILFDGRKQALHDKVAKTLVISTRPYA